MAAPANKRILCVEDNPDMCELIAAVLTDYKVVSASGVDDAWGLVNRDRFSLVILDYLLTDGNGIRLCEQIRTGGYQTPIVFITGDPDPTDSEILRAGAQRLIRKKDLTFVDELLDSAVELAVDV